jgi:hypothetical protein
LKVVLNILPEVGAGVVKARATAATLTAPMPFCPAPQTPLEIPFTVRAPRHLLDSFGSILSGTHG